MHIVYFFMNLADACMKSDLHCFQGAQCYMLSVLAVPSNEALTLAMLVPCMYVLIYHSFIHLLIHSFCVQNHNYTVSPTQSQGNSI